MHEHIARALYYFEIHLLYASIVGFAAWVLTSIRIGSATTKYWIWVATSLNFILPFGAVFDRIFASHLAWASPLGAIGGMADSISRGSAAAVLSTVWLSGTIFMLTRLYLRIRAERQEVHFPASQNALEAKRAFITHGVPVSYAEARQSPAVHGILRPHISLPKGIDRLLNQHELNAVLIHELTHARRRDNLIRLIHELGLCALWFHPLVWITGSRLALYRELSCDESVIQSAHGGDLVSALAKLANPKEAFLLQATLSSFLSHRLAQLAAQPQRTSRGTNALLALVFAAALLLGVFATVAHTACCWVART